MLVENIQPAPCLRSPGELPRAPEASELTQMSGRLPMKNDNELHCQEALDKNSGYSLHRREGLREFCRFPFRRERTKEGPS
jgi:hypothetical protein